MFDIIVDACLLGLKFAPDSFVTSKMREILNKVAFCNDDIDLDYIYPDIVTFFCDYMGINTMSLNIINLDDNSFNEDDPDTIIHVKLIAWCYKYKQRIAYKKDLSKELMLLAWHTTIWWGWCVPDDKKRNRTIFY